MTFENLTKTKAVEIQITQTKQNATFHVAGIIDEQGAAELKSVFEGLSLHGLNEVVFDFRNVTYIGSAGLGKLLLFYKKLSTENIKMRVNSPIGTVKDVLIELKLNTLFTVA